MMTRKRKSLPEISFVCDVCGKPQPKDESRSTENWSVFPANTTCECGGKFMMTLKDERNSDE